MISYRPLFETLKEKKYSTYKLIHLHEFSSSTINRLRHDLPVSTVTINDLCKILECSIDKIIMYIPDEEAGEEE